MASLQASSGGDKRGNCIGSMETRKEHRLTPLVCGVTASWKPALCQGVRAYGTALGGDTQNESWTELVGSIGQKSLFDVRPVRALPTSWPSVFVCLPSDASTMVRR